MKICLLGATFNTINMGVSALTMSAVQSIIHQYPDAEIFLLDYGKEKISYNLKINKKNIVVDLLNMRFSKKIYLKNNIAVLILLSIILKFLPFEDIKKKIISGNVFLDTICKSDIIGSIAGGDSFSDIYGLARYFYVSLPQLLVLFLKKDLILLPQTLGPFKGTISKFITRYILNNAKTVFSRDYSGLKEMESFLGKNYNPERFKFCHDVAFILEPIKPNKMDLGTFFERKKGDDTCVVGLNVSGLLYMGGYNRNNMFGLKVNYKELTYEIIDSLIIGKNATILLVPHVIGKDNIESDTTACEKIYNELKAKYKDKIFLAHGNYNQNEIKYVIGLCDFFVGARMHACIAALSQSIPAVSIAYSKKFFGVMESIGVESLVADPCKRDKNEIIDIISKSFDQRDFLKEKLEKKIPIVKENVFNLFNENT